MVVTDVDVRRVVSTRLAADAAIAARLSGAELHPIAGGWLILMGPELWVNALVGAGLDGLETEDLEEVEDLCGRIGVQPDVLVSSRVPQSVLQVLAERGFVLDSITAVYAGPPSERLGMPVDVKVVDDVCLGAWLDIHAHGRADRSGSDRFATAAHCVAGATDLLAMVDGAPAAVASMIVQDGRAWLGGAATLPAMRRRGLQLALLDDRLTRAYRMGCELVVCSATPGSSSARNIERAGLALVDMELTFTRSGESAVSA